MGRRGRRALSRAGILSGWVCTLHGSGTVGKGHDCGATQWDVRGEGDGRAGPVPLQSYRWRKGMRTDRSKAVRGRRKVQKTITVSPVQNNPSLCIIPHQ